jgi:hypothetical protein
MVTQLAELKGLDALVYRLSYLEGVVFEETIFFKDAEATFDFTDQLPHILKQHLFI